MRIKVFASYNLAGSERESIVDIPDEDLVGKTESEIERMKAEEAWDFACEDVDSWWEDAEEGAEG